MKNLKQFSLKILFLSFEILLNLHFSTIVFCFYAQVFSRRPNIVPLNIQKKSRSNIFTRKQTFKKRVSVHSNEELHEIYDSLRKDNQLVEGRNYQIKRSLNLSSCEHSLVIMFARALVRWPLIKFESANERNLCLSYRWLSVAFLLRFYWIKVHVLGKLTLAVKLMWVESGWSYVHNLEEFTQISNHVQMHFMEKIFSHKSHNILKNIFSSLM